MNIHIVKPYFSAYQKYGWDYQIPGIGIKKEHVEKALKRREPIYLTIGTDPATYEISPVTIKNIVEKYHSTFKARAGVLLWVFPRNRLVKLNHKEEEPDPINFGLFSC